MPEALIATDLSPFGELSAEDEAWLSKLQRVARADDHVIKFGDAADAEDDFIVTRDPFGTWWAGRYIGELAMDGRRLEIRPRLGEPVVEQWLSEALNLAAVPQTATQRRSASFLARLIGVVWCRAVVQASRHGPPAFRRTQRHHGVFVRGQLDVAGTVRLRRGGSPHIASVRSARDLENAVARTMVAAERTLTRRIGHDQWRTRRVNELLPRLQEAVGANPTLPRQQDLERIRFSPITRLFKDVAELSWRIARLQGLTASQQAGKADGLLLDVAELWELFVLNCMRRAADGLTVDHGTTSGTSTFLLRSQPDEAVGLGRLKPDVIVRDGDRPRVIADAKYKRLRNAWPERPQGVDRGDLYQLASYLSRFAADGDAAGLLLYPEDPAQTDTELAGAETHGPWKTENGHAVQFRRLPHDIQGATESVRSLLHDGTTDVVSSGAADYSGSSP